MRVGSKLEDNLIYWEMEDKLIFLENGRRSQFSVKWKTNLILREIEEDQFFWAKWKTTSILRKMEDDLNFKLN